MLMNSFFLCLVETSLGVYILAAISYSVVFTNFQLYSYPRFLSALTTFSIFVFLAILVLLIDVTDPFFNVLNGLLISSPFNSFFEVLLFSFGCLVLALNRSYYSVRGLFQYEFDIILVFSFLGLSILCLSNDLLVVYVVIELQSLAFYVLATFWRSSEFSNEAGLKYFVLGALSSCLLLLGFSFIYLSLGSTSFDVLVKLSEGSSNLELPLVGIILTLTAFLFKLGAFPCHMWLCDVYEGALVSVSAFFSIIPKTVIFCLLFKFLFLAFSGFSDFWSIICSVSGVLSVAVSAIAALYQKKTKRLFAYSAIGHVGFILLAFSTGMIESIKVSIIYLFIYMVMNVGVFSMVMGFSSKGFLLKYLVNWSFLKKWNIVLAITFALMLFSVAGIPPLAGFYSKLGVLLVLLLQEQVLLALIVVIFSCIACYFYVRLIKILFFNNMSTNVLIGKNSMKGFEFCLAGSTLFVSLFLIKPEFLNNIAYFVTLFFLN